MQNKKLDPRLVDSLWSSQPMYSTNPNIKVTSRSYDSQKCQRVSCDLDSAVKLLYTDARGKTRSDCISDPRIEDVKISICKIGKKNYLSDNGSVFGQLIADGMKKSAIMKLMRSVDTDYDIQILNDEICMEIADPTFLADCYRNMANVLIKVRCLAEAEGIR